MVAKILLTSSSIATVFCTVLLLVLPRSSLQLTYSCDSSAPCGCSSSSTSTSRIVGGESAAANAWGWAVSISISDTYLCGGAILSSSWIITAAHCMYGVAASDVTVYADSNAPFSGQSRVASNVIVHPDYESRTKVNDLALIQLSTPLMMANSMKSICMPSVDSTILSTGEWPPPGLDVCYKSFF